MTARRCGYVVRLLDVTCPRCEPHASAPHRRALEPSHERPTTTFPAEPCADVSRNTDPVRGLRARVAEAARPGVMAYIPSVRGKPPEGSLDDYEGHRDP